jgi:hypothetical protein
VSQSKCGVMPKDLQKPESSPPESPPKMVKPISRFGWVVVTLMGVIVPMVAWIFEFSSHPFGDMFFDPMPTVGHMLLIAAVPVLNLWMLTVHTRRLPLSRFHNMAMGLVLATTAFYSLLFLPLSFLGLVCVLFWGLGLLVLSPQLAFLSALFIRYKTVRCHGGPMPWRGFWVGATVATVVLLAAHLPTIGTRVAMITAANGAVDQRATALDYLRGYGSQEAMLEACYVRGAWGTDIVGVLLELRGEVDCDTARQIYYRTTGSPFNSVPPPDRPGLRDDWDAELGTATTGGVVKGLSLAESRMEGVVADHGLTAYYEWDMVFQNQHALAREARMQMRLPDGGVVSRVTLWIDGVPQEARFGGRDQTREAYEVVVSQQRDPLLVTTDGPNRVLVQCFPVPSRGEMRIRLGFSVPVHSEGTSTDGTLELPRMLERNFRLADGLDHRLKLGSRAPIESLVEHLKVGEEGLVGVLVDEELSAGLAVAKVKRAQTAIERLQSHEVTAELVETKIEKPKQLVFVIDRSEGMAKYGSQLLALEQIPEGTEFVLIEAGDMVEYPLEREFIPTNKKNLSRFIKAVGWMKFRGGTDSVPALLEALERYPGVDVVWIHTAQSVLLAPPEPLLVKLGGSGSRLHSVQLGTGADKLVEALGNDILEHSDLRRLFSYWGDETIWSLKLSGRELETASDEGSGGHLVRLWVADEVRRLTGESSEEATAKAIAFRLVTPLTGAVVLESEEQYDEAGLDPGEGAIPTVPEPEVWLLLIVVFLVLAGCRKKRVLA